MRGGSIQQQAFPPRDAVATQGKVITIAQLDIGLGSLIFDFGAGKGLKGSALELDLGSGIGTIRKRSSTVERGAVYGLTIVKSLSALLRQLFQAELQGGGICDGFRVEPGAERAEQQDLYQFLCSAMAWLRSS